MEKLFSAHASDDSLGENLVELASNYVQLGLDALVEGTFAEGVPTVNPAIAACRILKIACENHRLAKLEAFRDEINKRTADEEKREKYKKKFKEKERFRKQELEYLLVLIDRYINDDKPRLLAKLYVAYLEEVILWEEFTMYAEVIDRLLPLDAKMLVTEGESIIVHRNLGGEAVLRLVALGLLTETTDLSPLSQRSNGNISLDFAGLKKAISTDRVYKRTEFGSQLADILR